MLRDNLYECVEKALWVCGKGFIGVRKRLYEDVIRAFSQRGTGFFALRERTDEVTVFSICWYTTFYDVSSKPSYCMTVFWIC